MQISNNKSRRRKSQSPGKVVSKRINGARKNGGRQTRTSPDANEQFRFHLLEKDLKARTYLECALSGNFLQHSELASAAAMLDTEKKQLKAIEDLYHILRAQPKYKNLKEPVWNQSTEPLEVIVWLLRKLGALAKGERWTVDSYKQLDKIRYRFVVYKYYSSFDLKHREEYMPLDFLPNLKNRDEHLHDLIVDTVALVSRENKVPLWDEDGDFSKVLQEVKLREYPTGNFTLDAQIKYYTNGPAADYLKLIKQRRKIVTVQMVNKQLAKYQASSQRMREFCSWIYRGIRVAETKRDLSRNTLVTCFHKGKVGIPFQLYKFIWTVHSNDIVYATASSRLDKIDTWVYPKMFSYAEPGKILPPLEKDQYPAWLYDFMSYGIQMVLWRHKSYYYKRTLDNPKTPAEILLEKLESDEIKKSAK